VPDSERPISTVPKPRFGGLQERGCTARGDEHWINARAHLAETQILAAGGWSRVPDSEMKPRWPLPASIPRATNVERATDPPAGKSRLSRVEPVFDSPLTNGTRSAIGCHGNQVEEILSDRRGAACVVLSKP